MLLDGDRIATLASAYIRDLLERLPEPLRSDVRVGVVQTAYANGGATQYVTDVLKLPVEMTCTGMYVCATCVCSCMRDVCAVSAVMTCVESAQPTSRTHAESACHTTVLLTCGMCVCVCVACLL